MEYQQERLSVARLACIDTEVVGFFTLVTDCIDAKQVNYSQLAQGASCFIPLPLGSESTGSTALIRRLQVRIV